MVFLEDHRGLEPHVSVRAGDHTVERRTGAPPSFTALVHYLSHNLFTMNVHQAARREALYTDQHIKLSAARLLPQALLML